MMDRQGIFAGDDPFVIAQSWLDEAEKTEPNDPMPSRWRRWTPRAAERADGSAERDRSLGRGGRILRVLHQLRLGQGARDRGAGKAAFVLHWKSLRRQIRVRGTVSREEGPQADAYFASRSLKSRLGAWASQQSQPLSSREALMAEVAKVTLKHGTAPTRPPFWVASASTRSRSSSGRMARFGCMTAFAGREFRYVRLDG